MKKSPGAEARCNKALSARLKSCPDTGQEFFRSLQSRKTNQDTCGTLSTSVRAGSESRALIQNNFFSGL
jgi:hypothetical protein